MLYTLEIVQLYTYIRHFWTRDKPLLRFTVILCVVIDTICTVALLSWVILVRY